MRVAIFARVALPALVRVKAPPPARARLMEPLTGAMAAAWVTLLVFNLERWVDFYRIARTGLGRTEVGYVYQLLLSTGIAMVILGVPAACIGAVLPLMMRAMAAAGGPLGAQVGSLLTWNTLGAVAGTLVTGFGLMPLWISSTCTSSLTMN